MIKLKAKLVVNALISISVAVVFQTVLTGAHHAQGSRSRPVEASRRAEQDMMTREWNLTHIPDEVNKQFKQEEVSLFQQIHEDFKRMQIVNNQTMQAVFVTKSFDYKLISAATEEIRKRALRLKQNLVLPKVTDVEKDHKNQPSLNDKQLKASLLTLDHSVMSFVTNPLFTVSNVVDPKLAETARRDLERIIQFSEAIRKDVEKLGKTKPSQ